MTPLEKAGIASGHTDVRRDAVIFDFVKTRYEIPTIAISQVGATFNGYFYTARVKRLMEWEKKNGKTKT